MNKKNRVLAVIGMAIALMASCTTKGDVTKYEVKMGSIEMQQFDGVTVHSYVMPGGGASHILETETSLIVLDLVGSEELATEYSNYISSLNKPVSRVYLSHNHDHHLIPVDALKNAPHYTLDSIEDSFSILDSNTYAIPNKTVSAGIEQVDGINIEYKENYDGTIMYMVFTDQNIVWTQHLMYSHFHLPLVGAPVEQMISEYRGYDYYLASHGLPGDSATDEEFIEYQSAVNKAVKNNETAEGAIAEIAETYSDWGGAFLLKAMITEAYNK